MADDPEQLATTLHQEADLLIERSGLAATLRGYGNVHVTGSYALDLMAWRDLDIQLVLFEMWDPLDAFFALGHQIAKHRGVIRMAFGNHLRNPVPKLPSGLYWGIRMVNPDTGAEWNIGIWAVDEAHVLQNDGRMARIRGTLDDETRRLILRMKRALLTEKGRTPFLSGVPICEAVLFEGLRDEAAIREYLRQHEIQGV